MTVGVAVLAGGRGRRLGGAVKALVEVGGQTILARQRAVLEPLFAWRRLVAADPSAWVNVCDWPVLQDERPGALGPLAGLEAALRAGAGAVEAVVLVGCDQPLLEAGLLRALRDASMSGAADAVVPIVDGEPQPLLAAYRARLLEDVSASLDAGHLSLKRLLAKLDVTWWDEATLRAHDPALRSFINVNTPADLQAAEALATRAP